MIVDAEHGIKSADVGKKDLCGMSPYQYLLLDYDDAREDLKIARPEFRDAQVMIRHIINSSPFDVSSVFVRCLIFDVLIHHPLMCLSITRS